MRSSTPKPGFPIATAVTALLLIASSTFAAINPKDPTTPNTISAAIKAADAKQLPALILEIKQALFQDPGQVSYILRTSWLSALIAAHHHTQAADLAFEAILADPQDTSAVFDLQDIRVHALLLSGDVAQALAQSKALFNVASMEHTEQALSTVAACLAAAYPNDRAIIRRFSEEQIIGATTQPSHSKAPDQDDPSKIVSTLKSIHIDPAPYEETLNTLDPAEQQHARSRANLLLLAGKPAEAEALMQKSLEHELTEGDRKPDDVGRAAEEVARCIKAQDGLLGRANRYLLTLQF